MARPLVPPEIRQVVVERDKACAYCHRPVAWVIGKDAPAHLSFRAYDARGVVFHFEHKIPIAAGGQDTIDNIVLACPECNLAKGRSRDKLAAHGGEYMKNKTVWLREGTYLRLDNLRVGRETFNDIIERLIRVFRAIQRVPYTQSADDYFREEPLTDARAKKIIDTRPNRPTLPDVPTR